MPNFAIYSVIYYMCAHMQFILHSDVYVCMVICDYLQLYKENYILSP